MVVRRNSGAKSAAKARALERAQALLLGPDRGFRKERPDDDEWDCRNHARHQRITPGLVRPADFRKRLAVRDDQIVGAGHHQAAERCERLRVADDALPLLQVGDEELRQPRDGRDELDAHTHERAAAPEKQRLDRSGESGKECRERVQQDAPHQHAAAAEQVGEVAAEEAEHAARDRGHIQQGADPFVDLQAVGGDAKQFRKRGPRDERQHQKLVGVEREAKGGDRANQPLQRGQSSRDRFRSRSHQEILMLLGSGKILRHRGARRPRAGRERRHNSHEHRGDDGHGDDRQKTEDHHTGRGPRDNIDSAE